MRALSPQHIPFPGFEEAFEATWNTQPIKTINDLDEKEISQTIRIENRYEAIEKTVSMYVERLISEQNRSEYPPSFWFVVIPDEIYLLGRPQSRVPRSDREKGEVKLTKRMADPGGPQMLLFEGDREEAEIYRYARDFRRQLKARLLNEQIVTQIVRESTLTPEDFRTATGHPMRKMEDPATVAWKLGTGAYYKAGGRPWQLATVREGVCYVGLVYKKTSESESERFACCAAQMFLSDGDGVVFRGALGPWYSPETKQFHLDRSGARDLVDIVIAEYQELRGRPPGELFIHAKSSFDREEWSGFEDGCPGDTNLVGVQISDAKDDLKLYRKGKYPVIRGTAVIISDRNAFLWTTGYVPRLATYMGPETPNPIQVRIARGECDMEVVLQDIMALTKLNFNTCLYNDRLPVTIRFAGAVGEILVAAPNVGEPKLPFKYYI